MSCKYVQPTVGGSTFAPGSDSCPKTGRAVVWDEISGKCFKVYGLEIVIGDQAASNQAGWEVYNAEIHANGDQRCCTSNVQLGLMGPIA